MLTYHFLLIFLNLSFHNVFASYYEDYFKPDTDRISVSAWKSEVDKKIENLQEIIHGLEKKLDAVSKSKCTCPESKSETKRITGSSDYTINLSNVTLKLYSNDLKDILKPVTEIQDSACYFDINKVSRLQPLMVTTSLTWPNFEINEDGKMKIPKDKEFVLVCPRQFINIPQNRHVVATCAGGTKVLVNGVEHEYADLQCTEEVKHVLKKTGKSCLPGKSDIYKIVFDLPNSETIDLFEICMEKGNNDPIYTKFTMQSSFADVDFHTSWSDSDQFGLDFNKAYGDCKVQTDYISKHIGRPFHLDDQCCFALRQLLSHRDVFPGVAQKAAFTYVNTAALWSTCHGENWDDVERRVRSLAKSTPNSLLVWTGVKFDNLLEITYGNQWTHPPFYLWKVIQDPGTKSSLAIIQVNVPDVTFSDASSKYKLCNDVCDQTKWMDGSDWKNVTRGYTYCCTIEEFQEVFDFNAYEPYHNTLLIGAPKEKILDYID